jgi:4-hydroxy-2-oxoheptanedioate aldolase
MSQEEVEHARKVAVPNKLQEKLRAGRLAHSFSIKFIQNVEIVHYAAVAGYDSILIDLEHGTLDLATTGTLSISALQAGITPIVRVAANTSEWISRVLDAGAQAVIVPHVNCASDARRVVRHAKFAPLGDRSATNNMPQFRYENLSFGAVNIVSNEKTTVICMIESEEGLENLE